MIDAIVLVSAAVHALQRERGCSVVVSLSAGKEFAQRLQQQCQFVDEELNQLQAAVDNKQLPEVDASETRRAMKSVWKHLHEHRAQNMTLVESDSLIERFTQQIIAPLIALSVSLSTFTTAPRGQVVAFQHFMQWKERMALERGHGLKGFFQPQSDSQTSALIALIRKQREFEKAFVAMADGEQLHQLRSRPSEVGSVINLTHSLLESEAGAAALTPLTAAGWFELLSKRIDEMHQIELRLINHLRISSGATLVEVEVSLPSRLEQHREVLLSLPLLNNIEKATKEALLEHARVETCTPGQQLSVVGERPEWLFIVLDGWVKICSSNERGDEAILQMIGSGDTVIDAPVYRNEQASVQAEVEQKSLMLQIPAKTVREQLIADNVLLTNALQRLAVRSQRQLQHIERARLKSAQERVGWFLLSLRIEMDNAIVGTVKSITLPYNKATIASYLDMTPETFSRILKSFREEGITVQRNLVTLDDPRSLCVYCDLEHANQCARYKTDCYLKEEQGRGLVLEFRQFRVSG